MKQYLIVKCEELSDQWECDAYRVPERMTDDCSGYGMGYEVYEVQKDNTLKCIKEYDVALEEGFAVYSWNKDVDPCEERIPNNVYKKFKNAKRADFTKAKAKKLKAQYGFKATVTEIFDDIDCCGAHGEEMENGVYMVIGEYQDNSYSTGF